ncbi:hypothetical protein C2E31_28620 [Rhodopirellula baltica]|nr:hypothetical protein C2E31_28620 [Rhodopirellula baltica]
MTKAGLLVALVVASSSNAFGSCGDWLEHPSGQHSSESIQFDQPGQLPFVPMPCDGPNCQSAPFTPSAPAPFSSNHFKSAKDYGCPQQRNDSMDCDEDVLLYLEPEASLLSGHCGRVERPPKSA